jgi:hypothetical protein
LLKSIIGKDLINDDNIAVIELIKNSIDAGSPTILVEFKNLKKNEDSFLPSVDEDLSNASKLVITDFGKGMGEQDIEDKWLNIAYSEKKNNPREDGKLFAGSKGVGRFSCDRLGEYLDLYSRKKNHPVRHLHVRWEDFEVENEGEIEIQNINVLHEEISEEKFLQKTGHDSFEQGTIVEISKLRNKWAEFKPKKKEWDCSKLLKLRKYLEKLINPHQYLQKDSTDICLLAEDFLDHDSSLHEHERINGPVENRIFEKLDFKTTSIESSISENGKEMITTLKDKGRIIFRLKEQNTQFSLLKDVKLTLFYMNPYSKISFAKQTGMRTKDFGSIHLFVNGFRVSPYGDEDDDWLGLGWRKAQGYARFLGTRDLVGWVQINDKDSKFRIISNREGLVKNAEYFQLVNGARRSDEDGYIIYIFRKFEKYVVGGLGWDSIPVDEQKYLKSIESKVVKGNSDFNPKEKFVETQENKDLRSIEQLYSILSVDPKNIIELYINENLIRLLSAEKEERIEKVLADFSKIDPANIDTNTKDVITEVQGIIEAKKKEIEDKNRKLELEFEKRKNIEQKLETARIGMIRAERKAKEESDVRKKAEKQASMEKGKREKAEKTVESLQTQNIFLKESQDQDKERLISYLHHIRIKSSNITSDLNSISEELIKEKPDFKKIFKNIHSINFENTQIDTVSSVGSKGGFAIGFDENDFDIADFISEYLQNVYKYTKGKLNIHVNKDENLVFKKKFKPLDLNYFIDNFISNSIKARAKNIYFTMNHENDAFVLFIEDDGRGIPENVSDLDSLFEPGIRYSKFPGTGLGLYDAKNFVNKIGGCINVERRDTSGVLFKVVIK